MFNISSIKDLFKYIIEFKSEYVSYTKELSNRIKKLEDFKENFINKRDFQKLENLDLDLDIKELSQHFDKSYENFRQLKKKYQSTKDLTSMWVVYCKAYYLDELYAKSSK